MLAQFVRITASVSVSKPRHTKPLRFFGMWGCTLWKVNPCTTFRSGKHEAQNL